MNSTLPFADDSSDLDSARFRFPASGSQISAVAGVQVGRRGSQSLDAIKSFRIVVSHADRDDLSGLQHLCVAANPVDVFVMSLPLPLHLANLFENNQRGIKSERRQGEWKDCLYGGHAIGKSFLPLMLSEEAVAQALQTLKASASQPHVLEAFVGRVEAIDGDKAIVKLRNQSGGEWSEAACDCEVLIENGIGHGEEFTCEVVRENGETKVRFAKLAPRKISEEKAEEIRQRFAGRWES